MTETEQPTAEATTPVTPAKKGKALPKKKAGTKSAKKKVSHPPTSQMVTAAIKALKERGGSSLQAIKKYIGTTYSVDAEKMAFFIRKYIKSAVESGELVQTKGKGAAGSFRLGGSEGGTKKKPKKSKAKKPVAEKKTVAKKAKAPPAKKKETAPKAKKTKKPPTTPKAPKPKKATSPAKAKKAPAAKSRGKKPAKKSATKKK